MGRARGGRAGDRPQPPVSPHAAGGARDLRRRPGAARGDEDHRAAARPARDRGAPGDARRGNAGHRDARDARAADGRAPASARLRDREPAPPPALRSGGGRAPARSGDGACPRARAASLRRRAGRRGERVVGHQRRQPGAPARRHRRRAAGRAPVPLRGGVRAHGAGAGRALAGGRDGGARRGRGAPALEVVVTLRELVERHRIVISAGSGGVGKTTVAASIALWGALVGRRAVVITIDPARRLASSLGLETLGSEAREIPATYFAAQGLAAPRGSLAAMMLDQKGAWDALVERHAPAEARARILQNPFYQHLSQTFAGSQEYMAIEQLCLLAESGAYDLIVVDTPPTRHALDFLEAPRRIGDFLDRKVVKWFVRPYFSAGWSALRAMNRTAGFLLRRLEQATGISALAEISDFFTSMSGLFENFQPRVERAYQVLRGAETAFVLVTGPEEQVLGDAEYLSTKMAELHMPLKGVVFNRVHHEYRPAGRGPRRGELGPEDAEQVARAVAKALGGATGEAGALAANFVDYQVLARGESLRLEMFRAGLSRTVPVVQVPNFARDVHDLASLAEMHGHLFGGKAAA
ncbi:MAG: ArsA family ATPase [Deltaproteobacteria bacterium]|nr:MAG: ArsA family ATPase [Deltaproteobacteria bacterium]